MGNGGTFERRVETEELAPNVHRAVLFLCPPAPSHGDRRFETAHIKKQLVVYSDQMHYSTKIKRFAKRAHDTSSLRERSRTISAHNKPGRSFWDTARSRARGARLCMIAPDICDIAKCGAIGTISAPCERGCALLRTSASSALHNASPSCSSGELVEEKRARPSPAQQRRKLGCNECAWRLILNAAPASRSAVLECA